MTTKSPIPDQTNSLKLYSPFTPHIKPLTRHTLTHNRHCKLVELLVLKNGEWRKFTKTILHIGKYKNDQKVQSQINQTACNSTAHLTPQIKPLTQHILTHTIEIVNQLSYWRWKMVNGSYFFSRLNTAVIACS